MKPESAARVDRPFKCSTLDISEWINSREFHTKALIRRRALFDKFVAMTFLTSIVLTLFPMSASASNFGWYYADNANHYYAYVSLESYTVVASDWGRNRLEATDMTTYDDEGCTLNFCITVVRTCVYTTVTIRILSGIQFTEKIDCKRETIGNTDKCDSFRIRYDTSDLSTYSDNWLKRAGCHEWGHTAGLEHFNEIGGDYSCMWSQIDYPYQSTYFAGHDIAHINDAY